jgi:multiple sugar transport system substrate-binding protein
MKKLLFGFTALLLLLVSACRIIPKRDDTITITPVTITLSGWQSNPKEARLLQQVIHQFETQYPDIKVKYEVINSQYMDVIKTRLIGDVAPDVFYLEAFEAPALMQYGVLEPLDDYITPDFNRADFTPTLLNAFQHDGKLYGIPKDFSTLVLFYNQTAFAAANLTQPPKTWAELRTMAKKLTVDRTQSGKPDQYGLGIAPELARQTFMIKAFGGELVDRNQNATFAQPASRQGLQLVIDQYRRDRSAAQPSDVGATSGSEMFGQGKAAMVIEGPWAIPYLKDTFPQLKFATAEVPIIAGKPQTMAYTVAYVINRKSPHKAAAWKFVQYLTNATGMKRWAEQGLALPTRRSVIAQLGYDRQPLYAPFIAGANYATIWQAGTTLPTILTNFDNQFISALLGQQSLAAAMQKAQDTANREIDWAN